MNKPRYWGKKETNPYKWHRNGGAKNPCKICGQYAGRKAHRLIEVDGGGAMEKFEVCGSAAFGTDSWTEQFHLGQDARDVR